MIKLVAVDMDGTLLDPHGNITQVTIQTIRKMQEKGVEFIICTGRNYYDAKAIVESAGIQCGFICLSGAVIFNSSGHQLLNIPFSKEQLPCLISILADRRLGMDFLTSQGSYTSLPMEDKLRSILGFLKKRVAPEELTEDHRLDAMHRLDAIHFLSRPEDILSLDFDVYKICINDIPEDVVISLKEEFINYPQFAAASSFPTNIEITDVKAQKGPALAAYAQMKGISASHIMAIGDSDNDLSMFTMDFGYPVAMANAMDCIKEKTKYHTASNAEDGVACAIRDYILS